ncbi:flagellar basal body L-ring protein FlgH [Aestuariivirga sp.]|uniref:flagellar basal body L-ring protein FlgH n=1 Tax=Aestuariivirga sp. TaxID=2650926 RepID=UPI0039E62CA0
MKIPANICLLFILTGCTTNMDDFGQPPQLSPVGEGLAQSVSASSALGSEPVFSKPAEGWTGGTADYFRDTRARMPGDVITVRIAIDDKASLNNTSNRSRKSAADASLGFKYDLMGVTGADVNGDGSVKSNTSSAGQGSTVRSEKISLAVAAIVTSVLPNGYMVIDGNQEVMVNFEQRTLHVAGIVNPTDVTPDNSVSYERIAEARISYGGRGRITEVQQPGWAQQAWDRISPF